MLPRYCHRDLKPDGVVTDINLSQGDGLDFVREVRAHFPNLAILVLSAADELSVGANGYVTKQAHSLHLSIKTVESHRQRLKRKLNLAPGTQLVQFACAHPYSNP
ncbi:MAG: response regulator [Betaproteobacteria bacterium]